jgi:integrase
MRARDKRTLRELTVTRARLAPGCYYDARERGLFLRVRASGHRGFYFMYNHHGRTRWYHVGLVPLADARRIAARLRTTVAEGGDPAQIRRDLRDADTFGELARRYVEEWSRKRNRSWEQADYLVRAHLLPKWGTRIAREITRADVRAAIGAIESPSVANQTRAAASAIFSFGVKMEMLAHNPVRGVDRNQLKSRERVLSDSEIAAFWPHLSPPLRTLLLTGQRPGEISAMHRAHIRDGWWEMPGAPDPKTKWKGTKNGKNHRVWLPRAAREIIGEGESGRVFGRVELDAEMRALCTRLGVREKVTPHDVRRTHGTMITSLGFGRDAMNRIQNHVEGGITDVYDRHRYEVENKRVMEAVAEHVRAVAEDRPERGGAVVRGVFPSKP